MIHNMKRWHWLQGTWTRLGVPVWLAVFIGFISVQRVDPDFGWHYRSGEYILKHGVPHWDVFTYTARDFSWVNHEWLNDVLAYVIAHSLGYWWLGCLYAALWTVALMVAARGKLSWPVAGLALGATSLYLGVRGVTWTVLGLAVVLLIVRERRRYGWLAPLFVIWTNVHAGFAVGLAMVGLAALLQRDRRLAMWGGLATVATLLNPYGINVYLELWRTMSDGSLGRYIVEWAPLKPNFAVLPYVAAILTVLVADSRRHTFDWIRAAGLTLAAIWSNRHMPLLVVGTLAVVEQSLQTVWHSLEFLPRRRLRLIQGAVAIIVGVAYPVSLLLLPSPVDAGVKLARPTRALQELRDAPCKGRVFNDYNYGGLMIWSLPGVPVYIDGRMPSWSGPEGRYLDRYVEVLKGGEAMDSEFSRFDVQCVLISKLDTKMSEALAHQPAWRLVLRAQDAELWRRD